ncbi:recombinase family protein [Microbacterium dextranolyticum]|uniref:Recombinase family protein n=1 Tax=Microbacterium dextranolyticum TaxID=36806 RepID=A0A9W6HNG2_9MICO|nr:recombinase family protein [Microbacterium dextranolyticum]MBM7462929.1 DNA invertase Pin-like site-specific DNA recombinase [Microbacterium dextranolyticum]GLJ95966.1 hypothetical protein GCM10017591_20290 [Microbacterium dextranolyticum]
MSLKAALYARISADHKGEGEGVAAQVAIGRRVADRNGLEVVAIYEDNDVSASSNSRKPRPSFDAMLAAADRGEFEVIVAYSMSRLTRRAAEWVQLIDLARTRGLRFKFEASPEYDLNTEDGRAVALTIAVWDAAEAGRAGERKRARNAERVKSGQPAPRPRVFGFEQDGMTPRESEAALLREAYVAVLDGSPVREIAREWNDTGWRSMRGNEWSAVTVRNTLLRERNAGVLVANGKVQPVSRIEPIIDTETFETARAILTTARPECKGRPTVDRFLSGVASCSCGAHLVVGRWASHGKSGPAYVCQEIAQATRTPGRRVPSGHARIKADLLEERVPIDVLNALRHESPADTEGEAQRDLIVQRAAIAEQVARSKEMYSEFGDPSDLARARRLQAEHDDLSERIDALRADTGQLAVIAAARAALAAVDEWWHSFGADDAAFEAAEESMGTARKVFFDHWASLGADARRNLVRATLAAVRVNQPGDPHGRIQVITHQEVRDHEAAKARAAARKSTT